MACIESQDNAVSWSGILKSVIFSHTHNGRFLDSFHPCATSAKKKRAVDQAEPNYSEKKNASEGSAKTSVDNKASSSEKYSSDCGRCRVVEALNGSAIVVSPDLKKRDCQWAHQAGCARRDDTF